MARYRLSSFIYEIALPCSAVGGCAFALYDYTQAQNIIGMAVCLLPMILGLVGFLALPTNTELAKTFQESIEQNRPPANLFVIINPATGAGLSYMPEDGWRFSAHATAEDQRELRRAISDPLFIERLRSFTAQ